jgi:hypothetical protein
VAAPLPFSENELRVLSFRSNAFSPAKSQRTGQKIKLTIPVLRDALAATQSVKRRQRNEN